MANYTCCGRLRALSTLATIVAEFGDKLLNFTNFTNMATVICRRFRITPLETVKIVTFYHSATSVLLNVLLLIGVFLRYNIVT